MPSDANAVPNATVRARVPRETGDPTRGRPSRGSNQERPTRCRSLGYCLTNFETFVIFQTSPFSVVMNTREIERGWQVQLVHGVESTATVQLVPERFAPHD